MSIPGSASPLFLSAAAAAAPSAYQIDRSLRFNSSDSAYLSRTPSSAGNRKTWTWSGWVKRVKFGAYDHFFGHYDTDFNPQNLIRFTDTDKLEFIDYTGSYQARRVTSAVYRDPSAWMHVVIVFDSTQSTANDRIKVYVNGNQITDFDATVDPSQNYDSSAINTTVIHGIGRVPPSTNYFNGYLADVHFIDGQALDPTDFGEFDANNVWQPKAYAGTYGTNGFHLPFSDNSSAAALGTDTSGNSNTWTVNNISVAAGAGNDSLVDSPTNGDQTDTGAGGEVVGNYATWNPLENTGITFSNGNLDSARSVNSWVSSKATIGAASGKYYFEYTINSGSSYQMVGVHKTDVKVPNAGGTGYISSTASGWVYQTDGNLSNSGSFTNTGISSSAGDVIMVAFDVDAGKVWFGRNGTWFSSGNPATGANASYLNLSGRISPATSIYGSQTGSVNFGQRPFAYTAPSGYKALCTTNLADPTIADGSTAFDALLYTGNGIDGRAITGLNFAPDFVWVKGRSSAAGHVLQDIVRGAGDTVLSSHNTAAEGTEDYGQISSFDSAGFTVTSGSIGDQNINDLSVTYVAWTWDAGSSTVSNTDGSLTSSVRANPSVGFSIATFTDLINTAGSRTWGHGLNAAPQFILLKSRSGSVNWQVYHAGYGTGYAFLNSTNAFTSSGQWSVTSTTAGHNGGLSAGANPTVCYHWAPVEGYSAFGKWTGGSDAFVYLGFRPKFLLIKANTAGYDWLLFDSERSTFNLVDDWLSPNLSAAEVQSNTVNNLDFLSNGFKIKGTGGYFGASVDMLYAAFSEHPFKTARAR